MVNILPFILADVWFRSALMHDIRNEMEVKQRKRNRKRNGKAEKNEKKTLLPSVIHYSAFTHLMGF